MSPCHKFLHRSHYSSKAAADAEVKGATADRVCCGRSAPLASPVVQRPFSAGLWVGARPVTAQPRVVPVAAATALARLGRRCLVSTRFEGVHVPADLAVHGVGEQDDRLFKSAGAADASRGDVGARPVALVHLDLAGTPLGLEPGPNIGLLAHADIAKVLVPAITGAGTFLGASLSPMILAS